MKKCEMCYADNPDDATYCMICGYDFTGFQTQPMQANQNPIPFAQQSMNQMSQQQNFPQPQFQQGGFQQYQGGITCPRCGTVNPPGVEVCGSCGAELKKHKHHFL
ncbi:hypothetical protein HS7_15640 [Sulfolobales archaeon HS-7]|nr:hypothetical protein HS7_15640 [Sulfolobales archaeon HS-7]